MEAVRDAVLAVLRAEGVTGLNRGAAKDVISVEEIATKIANVLVLKLLS